jgi:cell division septum initiation protein DivIVA
MEITPRELRDVEIAEAFRGYHRDVVNDLLERAAATIEATNERVRELSDRLNSAQVEAARSRETEDILHRTLLLAQRAADEAVAEAQQKSRQLMEDAELHSHKLLAEAESNARQRGESERRRLEQEVLELADRRAALLADVDALGRFEGDFRERMVRALEADLSALQSRPSASPGPVPEPQEVELPVLAEAIAPRPEPATPAPAVEVERSDPAPTGEVDMAALFESAAPAPTPTPEPSPMAMPRAAATPPPEPPAPEPLEVARDSSPIDLLGDDALEGDVLDDDAFFATLREAVHDDTPLGPRDEDDDNLDLFNDDNGDRSGFRDVFRRRR